MARMYRVLFVVLAVAASTFIFTSAIDPGSAKAAVNGCGSTPYSYAGLQTNLGTHGIAAMVTVERAAVVASGHVAGWIGVGGPGEGANGTDAWIQIGLNAVPGRGNVIYAEAWIPGYGQVYKELGEVPVGKQVRLAILEVKGQPGTWRAWVDGKPVTEPVVLRGSEGGTWQADALGESWRSGSQVCNGYAYRFENIRYATAAGGVWRRVSGTVSLQDPGYRLVRQAAGGFVVTS
jgi:hypothetical protein